MLLPIESDAVDRGPDARAYGETGAATPEFEVTAYLKMSGLASLDSRKRNLTHTTSLPQPLLQRGCPRI